MENNQPGQQDPQEATTSNPTEDLGPEDGSEQEKSVGEGEKEKEEEEAFLVSLYKFMKDRHTPIERIPHLGFKQINLWKIYKAVEKLGAYELVTGRRLWKNVYDELGGSPGSTSAATCTRRHYERLVLPYVRHLKGEEDKPLPPSKPRKQYKGSKDDKSKRARKEKGREQMPLDKVKTEVAAGTEDTRDIPERGRVAQGSIPAMPPHCSSLAIPTPSPSEGRPSPCQTHSETYKCLFSSFYSKGNHPIMSPLAKKKLLAQVSEAESRRCHKRHCLEGRWAPSTATTSHNPPRPAPERSPEPSGAQDTVPSIRNEVGPSTSASPGGTDTQGCPRAENGGPAPAVFTGYFHAYRSEGLPPSAPHPLWGYFSNLKDFLEPPPAFPESEQPQDLRSKVWESQGAAVQAWVPPRPRPAARARHGHEEEEEDDEEPFGPKFGAMSPFPREAEGRDMGSSPPGGHRGLAKPKAVVASPSFAALHFPPTFGSPLEHLKTQGVPVAPALSANPFVIPAFPSPLVVGSTQPPELCRPLGTGPRHYPNSYRNSLRHRSYPWHSHHSYGSQHMPAFHRHTKL
ncbi:PREDICTED: AT-rich interactive domain-containing protein 5A isoform X1 [Lepidothrix coronata]|uniref:AT-rich interactive domain-containing protein 5A isoform X1 n=2 Tax=Lepidothrix coronata TaxID=321398 RepID=A0A6J0IL66_9PASS|nr:PREDICTED: AT-rich interactive domain-containing protein 5A isoform X1 [Lepidothrix coronata]XP_017687356.1 PREDICTED: AT-rich interactive domain-containing protein 5A isoform X1 [Lepidothrix coronata]XP_017687357.1 PREDICTED: AT-rich interactive domain-containing protein 5A isoform X1 [Lepidothrix coronata]XP_017687358.1 PREDICTED: AT-rich interactive domain-containing protein 5A isoform X1 [Lepidothrix coronata]XP_017687359.1 PREDICTED: AT-rich interactive domain-containing protein 5A isof